MSGHLLDRWRHIAPRLIAGFVLPLVLTAAIGVIAVQRFAVLTAMATELTTRDLPEVIAVGRLRTLLFRQLDLENSENSDAAAQGALRLQIEVQRASLLALEHLDSPDPNLTAVALANDLANGVTQSLVLAERLQALRAGGDMTQARAVVPEQQALLETLLSDTDTLRTLEESEATTAAMLAGQESLTATQLVSALTLLLVPVSVLVALLLTRTLTRPLAALLQATRAVAAGNLDASPGITSDDEIGQLARAFETMRSNLRTTIAALDLERRQTQAVIDASVDGVILVDGQHRIVQLNPATLRLSGWSASEAIGQYWWTVLGCSEPPSPVRSELLVHPRAGQGRWVAFSYAPVAWDGPPSEQRLVVNLHDVSELKAIDQLKSDFVAMVSHELRAPLTTVAGAVEMLETIDPSAESSSYSEVIGILHQQTRRLRTVIEEVLQVTRLEAGRLPIHLEPVAIVGFLESLVDSTRLEWGDDQRTLTVQAAEGEDLVWADSGMLEIVVQNVLDNARKYTPQDSAIEIEVRPKDTSGRLDISINDHGPGIPTDQLEHIFKRFSRGAKASNGWSRGYGLGLYIARELVRAQGGDIWAQNGRDGARFIVSLCRVAPNQTEAPDDR